MKPLPRKIEEEAEAPEEWNDGRPAMAFTAEQRREAAAKGAERHSENAVNELGQAREVLAARVAGGFGHVDGAECQQRADCGSDPGGDGEDGATGSGRHP